jgi:RHS repeat-associated protein
MRDNTGLYYLHGDHLGSASVTTLASGGKASEMRYTPFGSPRVQAGEMQSSRRFTSQNWDAGVGLYDYSARMYNPLIGKFVSADSVVPKFSRPQSLNRYAYVENRPLNLVDPTGHCGTTPQGNQVCPTGGTLSIGPVVGEWHAPMSLPQPYTVKVLGNEYQTSVGSTAYQIDQVAYAILPTTLGLTLGGGVSGGQTPVVVQASSNVAGACNWRSAECGGFSGYQISAGSGVAEGASGNFDAGIFATWGNSDLSGVAGPNNIVTINGKIVPGVGGNATVTLGQSVDEKTRTPAVDKVSGYRINSVGISAGPSFGANVETSVQVSPAYIPGVPKPLNNTVEME